ncbi:zinc finger protein 688 isoform X1 [Piliocolobus tephrosceles]|uniref:zinc finger protein 688 isoform X1 n=1 Tax=Piliocolobus tephrosceles TaxID=591936 RepID=UPI000C2AA092|nr:zinc finger protein 688 isoform X1 [Piliocolobus tephrosceles]
MMWKGQRTVSANSALLRQHQQPPPVPRASGTPSGVFSPASTSFRQQHCTPVQVEYKLRVGALSWRGMPTPHDGLSGPRCDPCSLPGFPGPKPALISWMEQESEAWSPAAQDPEKGERLGGARRGDAPNRKEEEPEEVPRAKGPRKAPVKESPEVLVECNPDPAISVAPARAQPPKNAAWDPTTGAQPPTPMPSVDAQAGQRRHVCTDCGRRFTYPSLLVSHRRMHSGERPFPCPECGMRFKRKFAVEAHQWIHRSCSGGRRGRRPGIRAVPRAPVRGDRDPPVLFRHYPDIFEECS